MKTAFKGESLDPFNDPISGGKHAGERIPRLIVTNPGWFYWSMDKGNLKRSFDEEKLMELFQKSAQIIIPPDANGPVVADYYGTEADGLILVKLRSANLPVQASSSGIITTKNVLDLTHDYRASRGSRRPNYTPVLNRVIEVHFGGSRGNVTEEAAIRFFGDNSNFRSGI
jgi:hypothetical protein